MSVAEKSVFAFKPSMEHRGDDRLSRARVYAAQRTFDEGEEHDAKGLMLAIVLCMGCWAALAFYLLS